jgi:hypothetical protein
MKKEKNIKTVKRKQTLWSPNPLQTWCVKKMKLEHRLPML